MSKRRYRLLLVASHVVQYAAPLFRHMAQHPKLDVLVAYCTLQGAEPGLGTGFGVKAAWDIPLLEGYPWIHVPHWLPAPTHEQDNPPLLSTFFRLVNPGLWPLIKKGNFDAVIVYGYAYLSCWIAVIAAKFSGSPVILQSDASGLDRDGKRWKLPIRRLVLPKIYGMANAVSTTSRVNVGFFQSLGIARKNIFVMRHTVDNDHFSQAASAVCRDEIRNGWNVPAESPVALFCGKLHPPKRPQDLVRAFSAAGVPQAYLVFAGDGPLRDALMAEARSLGISDRVRLLGFVNQSKLAGVYVASDLQVLPSEYEAWGLVINEGMVCGLPAVVSDRVGARADLIEGHDTGFVYPVGDVRALATILRTVLPDRERLRQMGRAAHRRMETWSYREHVQDLVDALEKVVACKPE